MQHNLFSSVSALLIVALFALSAQANTKLNTNLLTNGSGEAGTEKLGVDTEADYFALPGWTVEEGAWVAQDGAWHEIGAIEGDRHIRPEPSASAKLSQTVELELPRSKDRYIVLKAMIRNWTASNDLPSMQLELLDAKGKVIANETVGPIKDASWQEYAAVLEAPRGTASARARLIAQRTAGSHNDAYFDHIRLTVHDKMPLLVRFKAERIADSLPPKYRFTDETPGKVSGQEWVFSDGAKLSGKSVERSFEKAGRFGVTLTVKGRSGQDGSSEMPAAVEVTEDDLELRIIKGPYLQMPTKDGMTIMWQTNAAAKSVVTVGSGSRERRIKSDEKVTIHEVRVEGYKPGETVPYRVMSKTGKYEVKSEASTFTTAPDEDKHWRLAVWGDSQDRPHVFGKLVRGMEAANPDLLLGVGDLVSTGTVYEQWENRLFTPIKPLAKKVPFIAVLGNHEYNADWWYRLLSLPRNERWYAYNYGNARFIILDTNAPFGVGSEQRNWLIKELKSKESKNATWLITAHHHPPFSEIHEDATYGKLRRDIWPLYEQAGVDVNLHGHIHSYESGEYIPKGTGRRIMSVQTSGGGGTLWQDEFDGDWPQIDTVIQWKHHWCQLDFKGDELFFKAIDINGNVIDEWQLKALPR